MNGLYDIHCHILPGVDDGAKSLEEAVWMLKKEYADGVRRIIVTPHFRYGMFEPPMEEVKKQFLRLQKASAEIGDDLILYLGCELHASMDMVSCLREGERLTLAGSRYVLVEFGNADEKSYMKERIQKLKLNGYNPIIAHVERYRVTRGDITFIEDLRDLGAYIQVNADSISGKDGLSMKWFVKKLMKMDLLDFIGTDGHGSKNRVPDMAKCYSQVVKLMGEQYARTIMVENPKKITG
jgi:protein-tyrosine phosphatase